jgi:type I restriction-modification system DNA methylase subunit
MADNWVDGMYQDEVFVWWTDGYAEGLYRGHEAGACQFEEVAEEAGGVERISDATRDRFSRAVAEVFFNVLRFDFGDVEGDLLGDLYQRYFDPETRKALGEFYTPQPVIDYIMDGVGYDRGVSNERLIDPACGSGTFLVEAVRRYIEDVERYEDDPDWEEHLKDLCTRPRIVGLDIHPFAVLMAQIRFVVAILPAYRKAKDANHTFTLRRLPIYRTDTLRNERELTGADLGEDGSRQMTWDAMTEDEQDVRIPVPLPLEVDDADAPEVEDGFLVRRVRMPLFDTIQLETGVGNFGEYFAALQGVLDTVKAHMELAEEFGSDFDWTYQSGLEERVNHYTSQEYSGVEEFFVPYVDDMLENVRYLKEEHNDGRLFKIFEDTVLSLVVKNYMEYDYVVGNPPYVRVQHLPERQKQMLDRLYDSTTGNYDIYCIFYERGLEFLKEGTGKLGYITSNQFLLTDYGEGIRRVLLERSEIEEIYDFRDSGVFDDAANLPVILFAREETDETARNDNQIRCSRVKSNISENSQRRLDSEVIETIREHKNDTRYSDQYVDIFDFPQNKLDDEFWSLMPPEELAVFEKLDNQKDGNIREITDSVFAGTQTSANGVYVVTLRNADYVGANETGGTVKVSPTGDENKVFEIETDLLRPWLQGIDVQRWRGDWSGQHVILPYHHEETGEGAATVYSPEYIQDELPLTWSYFEHYRETLEGREGGRMEDDKHWYAFIYPKNHERFEKPKIINADMASNARFMLDETGEWYFKTPYGLQLTSENRHLTKEVACQLNSKALDFYLKHIAPMLLGGKYRYQSRYIGALPCKFESEDEFTSLVKNVEPILDSLDLSNKSDRFPEAYLGEFDGELDYITYEWQTRRYPVSANVQGDVDGEFTVQAGRSDTITHPAMYADDREARKRRAQYVHAAVDGRNVKSGEESTIPIPRTDAGVERLLSELDAD